MMIGDPARPAASAAIGGVQACWGGGGGWRVGGWCGWGVRSVPHAGGAGSKSEQEGNKKECWKSGGYGKAQDLSKLRAPGLTPTAQQLQHRPERKGARARARVMDGSR